MKRRIITARREILAKDANDLNEFIEDNFIVYSRDILGVSDGIAQGLTLDSFTALNITINAGVAFSNGKFYELLTNQTLTLPSVDGVYKIYALKSSTSDLPISGYVLLDTATRQETYDAVNSRTYDSLTLGYTLGSVPSNAFLLGEATVSGSIITTYDDQRTLTSIGNLASNSIQAFSETARNYGTSENEITGFIFDQTDIYKPFVKVTIDDTFEGKAIVIDNGTNAGSQGIYNLVRGNIGSYTTFSGNDGIGSYSEVDSNNIGFFANAGAIESTVGFKAVGLQRSFYSVGATVGLRIDNAVTTSASIQLNGFGIDYEDRGIELVGFNEGIKINNSRKGYIYDNTSLETVTSAISAYVGSYINLEGGNSSTVFNYGSVINVNGNAKVGQSINITSTTSSDNISGLTISASGTESTAVIGANIGGDAVNMAIGVNISKSNIGLNINPLSNQRGIQIFGDNTIENNNGIVIDEIDKPIEIFNSTNTASNGMIKLDGDSQKLSLGINAVGLETAFKSSYSTIGLDITNFDAFGIKINSNVSNTIEQKAIEIYLQNNNSNSVFNEGIRFELLGSNKIGSNYNFSPTNSSSTMIGSYYKSTNNADSNQAIIIDAIGKGISISNSKYPIQITSTSITTSNIDIVGSGLSNSDKGITLTAFKDAIKITDSRHGFVYENTTLSNPSSTSDQSMGTHITLTNGNTTTAYPNIGHYVRLNGNNKVGIYQDLASTSNTHTLIGFDISNENATNQSDSVVGGLIGGKLTSYKFGAGLIIHDSKIGIDLSSEVDVPFKVPLLQSSDPLPSSPTEGTSVFKIVDSLSYELHIYDGTNWLVHA